MRNLAAISYRFTGSELCLLKMVLNLSSPAEWPLPQADVHQMEEAFSSLQDAGLLLRDGRRVVVDGQAALLMRILCDRRWSLTAQGKKLKIALFSGAEMFLLVRQLRGEQYVFTPHPDLGEAMSGFLTLVPSDQEIFSIRLWSQTLRWAGQCAASELHIVLPQFISSMKEG